MKGREGKEKKIKQGKWLEAWGFGDLGICEWSGEE